MNRFLKQNCGDKRILPKYLDLFDKNAKQKYFSMSFECTKVVFWDKELGLRWRGCVI